MRMACGPNTIGWCFPAMLVGAFAGVILDSELWALAARPVLIRGGMRGTDMIALAGGMLVEFACHISR